METKNNTGLVVAVTILAMLVLGLLGFIVYDKVIKDSNEPNIEENNKENDKEQNSNSNNHDSQSSTSERYSYKLVSASSEEIEKIDNVSFVWESGINNQVFGMTGFSGSFSDNKTLELETISDSNTIKFSSSVLSYEDISDSNLCNSLNCKADYGMHIVFLLNNGKLYFCSMDCLLDAESEDDMLLLLTDKSVQSTAYVDGDVFVKTDDGIKKIVYAK